MINLRATPLKENFGELTVIAYNLIAHAESNQLSIAANDVVSLSERI